jgi:hypothetical protein
VLPRTSSGCSRDTDRSGENPIEFRVGNDVGDVIVDENGIYCDSVNVSARSEVSLDPVESASSVGVIDLE